MQVTFLGTGDAFGSGGRGQACLAVEEAGRCWLLDCGATALVSMRQRGFDPSSVDAVLLTHLHGDHFGGLPFLVLEEQFHARRAKPLVVAGPPGAEERLAAAGEVLFPGLMAHRRYPLEHLAWRERVPIPVLGATATPFAVEHPSGATPFALRLEVGGKVLCYSGDSAWTPALAEASRDADLFVVESTGFDVPVPTHLAYRTLREHAAELTARRTVLTHLGPEALAHVAEMEWEVARDGLVLTV